MNIKLKGRVLKKETQTIRNSEWIVVEIIGTIKLISNEVIMHKEIMGEIVIHVSIMSSLSLLQFNYVPLMSGINQVHLYFANREEGIVQNWWNSARKIYKGRVRRKVCTHS